MKIQKRIGAMIDCSRNAVMKPEQVKKMIKILKAMGYDYVSLYLEDTYEVDNQPMFGYMRGIYNKLELKDFDNYSKEEGIELIPCIQTLAHLNQIFRWKEYSSINDINDILLIDDQKTYDLIEDMFKTISDCFSSRTINIGMDEAHLLGRGQYFDKNGKIDSFELLLRHLNKVDEIAKKYGFHIQMWSDMFFNKTKGVSYTSTKPVEDIINLVPKNVDLICWDYYHTKKDFYTELLKGHKIFKNKVIFACSAYVSRGFAPNNAFSISEIKAGIEGCFENDISDLLVTMWGGNGAECSFFSVLPVLFYASKLFKGKLNEKFKEEFEELFGEKFDNFMLLDLPNDIYQRGQNYGPSKLMLYNDIFCGIFDYIVKGNENEKYLEYSDRLFKIAKNSQYGYIFNTLASLCKVLSIKYELGVKTRNCYKAKDIDGIKNLIKDYDKLLIYTSEFYEFFKMAWLKDNKPFGFEVQNIRIGGLQNRIGFCKGILEDYIAGKISKIEELEIDILNIETGKKESGELPIYNDWKTNVSVNII